MMPALAGQVIWAPLLPMPLLVALTMLAAALVALGLWRRLAGAGWRALAAAMILAGLGNPSWQVADRRPRDDIAVILVDDSASQQIGDRAAQTAAALAGLHDRLAALPGTRVEVAHIGDDDADGGTLAMARLREVLAELPRGQLAGVFLISDGQVHDATAAPDLAVPLHLVLTGRPDDWDRRIEITAAPAFAIMGEPFALRLRIAADGAVPAGPDGTVTLEMTIGAQPPLTLTVPVGPEFELPLTLPNGGMNLIRLTIPPAPGELTERNNTAIVQVNGVRDRLRVLLVSGEPHPGERVWRNLLKSDAAVDLVHFTILRPPEKQDGVPVSELALIAFPTHELFVERLGDFDLVIFDRYRRRGILPMAYLENIRDYVRAGGAVLISAGPEFGSADSLWRTPLAEILPITPSGRVIERGFHPRLTDLGHRHPVTAGLDQPVDGAEWGRWFRQIEVQASGGQTVMAGIDDQPLLVLDRAGKGRVALLASDQIWLWGRGFEGGGPQLELLRRLAHWTMKEPDLEEEALTATAAGQVLTFERRTLADQAAPVTITAPDGTTAEVALHPADPGRWLGEWVAPEIGLYRLESADRATMIAVGPAAPREFERTLATADRLAPAVQASGGGVVRLADGLPEIRRSRAGRATAGRGWLGIVPQGAHVVQDIRIHPLLPAWLLALLAAGLILAAWLHESRAPAARRP